MPGCTDGSFSTIFEDEKRERREESYAVMRIGEVMKLLVVFNRFLVVAWEANWKPLFSSLCDSVR